MTISFERTVLSGICGDFVLAPYEDHKVLVTHLGLLGERNWNPDKNHKLYEIQLVAEIPVSIAVDAEFQRSLRSEPFIPSGIIWAVNRQGALNLKMGHLFDEYFSIEIKSGDHTLFFRRIIDWRDEVDPTMWLATIQYFNDDPRDYVVNSLHLNEKVALDLIHDWVDSEFVIEKL